MVNISKFIENNMPLCVCTLGLAILGYLGYHAVRWIINKCQRTENIDQLAQAIINNPSSSDLPNSLKNRLNHLELSPDKITMGQGEYIVFHKLPNGEKQSLSPETFEKTYKVLLQHSPAALVNSGTEKCANRYELIKAELKKIDPNLEAIFVPRTLYELIFIRQCIQEDLDNKRICPYVSRHAHTITVDDFGGDQKAYNLHFEKKETSQKTKGCWHRCYFKDAGDNEHAGVKDVAYRLNKVMLELFNPQSEGFTHQEFSDFAENEIKFLKSHYQKGLEITKRLNNGETVKEDISDCSNPGPTTNFGFESTRTSIRPMGIRNEADAQIIRDAMVLDCSKIAQRSFFLYRGSNFIKDSVHDSNDKNTPYSLSYGTSLFAGCLYDGGATAFHHIRQAKNAYAVPVPFDQLNNSPFYIPTTHTVAQLFGDGEIFHARTKAWKDFNMKKIRGMSTGANSHIREHLKSNLSQNDLIDQFKTYKAQAIHLK